jgi:hypothetical protein
VYRHIVGKFQTRKVTNPYDWEVRNQWTMRRWAGAELEIARNGSGNQRKLGLPTTRRLLLQCKEKVRTLMDPGGVHGSGIATRRSRVGKSDIGYKFAEPALKWVYFSKPCNKQVSTCMIRMNSLARRRTDFA